MAITDSLMAFVEQVRKATDEGRIAWEEGASENEFIATIGPDSLRIFPWTNSEDCSEGIALWILNPEGKMVDLVSSDEGTALEAMNAILTGARRIARNADCVMSRMMERLKKK